MNLQTLNLVNFRSFDKISLEFAPVSVIVGANSAGKTNILESIYLLSVGTSLRGDRELELIKFGQNFGKVFGLIENDSGLEARLTLSEGRFKKEFFVNGVRKRLIDYLGNLRTIIFSPVDLDLVTDSPNLRRSHLDSLLSQLDYPYYRVALSYERALMARNKLLLAIAEKRAKKDELVFWDETLAKLGHFITRKRQDLFIFLNNFKSEFGQFSWRYLPNLVTLERLRASFEKDLQTAATNVGPHRDEFRFLLAGNDLGLYGSRGEQRLAVLALKLAELEFVSLKTGARPVLLLDDVFSELDAIHRDQIAKIVENQQTILTTTDLTNLNLKFKRKAKLIEL